MANAQATLVFETDLPIPFTVANATAIEKGDLLKLSDLMTAQITGAANDLFCGIAAEEKIANDGRVKIGVYRRGIFKVEVGTGNCTVGKDGVISAKNELIDYTTLDGEKGERFGKFLETGTDGETVLFELGA